MTFDYDDDADVLYVTFEEFKGKASYVETDRGDILRLHPGDGKIIGCTIPFFMKRSRLGPIEIPEIGVVPFNRILTSLLEQRSGKHKQ